MWITKRALLATAFLLLAFTFAAPHVQAQSNEYRSVVRHLKTKYRAKKVRIPFLWLARVAVGIARPAGVKSFNVTLFQDLNFSRETLDEEMQAALRSSFGSNWSPVLRVRSREGEQVYMYMREAGESVRVMVVSVNKQQAAIVRATFNPERLADFISNPNIFGVSLSDGHQAKSTREGEKPAEEAAADEKDGEAARDN